MAENSTLDAKIEALDLPPNKSYVSQLHEMATHYKFSPEFDFTSEGKSNNTTFTVRSSVKKDDSYYFLGKGVGKTKSAAKHLAARESVKAMLNDPSGKYKIPGAESLTTEEAEYYVTNLMKDYANMDASGNSPDGSTGSSGSQLPAATDNVSRLQELVMKRRWPTPAYKETTPPPNDEVPQQERLFEIEVYVGEFMEKGIAPTKKGAKKMAAEKMLEILMEKGEDAFKSKPQVKKEGEDQDGEEDEDEEVPVPPDTCSLPLVPPDRFDVIAGRSFGLETPSVEHYRLLLQLVATKEWPRLSFEPTYNEYTGAHSTTADVKVSDAKGNPVIFIAMGQGRTPNEALFHCSSSALRFLAENVVPKQ